MSFEKYTELFVAYILGIISPKRSSINVITITWKTKPSVGETEKSNKLFERKEDKITIPTLIKLLEISIVASKRFGDDKR